MAGKAMELPQSKRHERQRQGLLVANYLSRCMQRPKLLALCLHCKLTKASE